MKEKIKIGDVFQVGDEKYRLCQVMWLKVSAIGEDSANRWVDPVDVKDISDISAEELSKIFVLADDVIKRVTD